WTLTWPTQGSCRSLEFYEFIDRSLLRHGVADKDERGAQGRTEYHAANSAQHSAPGAHRRASCPAPEKPHGASLHGPTSNLPHRRDAATCHDTDFIEIQLTHSISPYTFYAAHSCALGPGHTRRCSVLDEGHQLPTFPLIEYSGSKIHSINRRRSPR